MFTSTPHTTDVFPISVEKWRDTFLMAGRFDDETLPLAEELHFRNVPEDGPLHYLQQELPLRPTLLAPDRELDRSAYQAGLWLGSTVMRKLVRIGLVDARQLIMPPEPLTDQRISTLRRQAAGHRFRLQQFFEREDESEGDVLASMYRLVEYPWHEHNVRFGVNKGLDTEGKPHDDHVVVGAGDMLALSYALLLDHPPAQTVPLVGVDAVPPISPVA